MSDPSANFEPTLPLDEPELMRASGFQRYLEELKREQQGDPSLTRLSQLNPSLMQDLMRFEQDGRRTEVLEVLAACIRHARPLALYLQCNDHVIPLTVFPLQRLAHCPMPMSDFLSQHLAQMQVLRVEPAVLRPPGDTEAALVGEPHLYHPLAPVAWELAIRGAREQLLPEIGGVAAYRIAAGSNLRDVPMPGVVRAAVHRLQRRSSTLRDIAAWAGFTRGRAMRLLNGLYLQGSLIVSRTHPTASNDSWFGITRF
jgi:hypothetical protein